MVSQYGSGHSPLPIALTEFNIFNANSPQTVNLTNAMQLSFNGVIGHKNGGGPFPIDQIPPFIIDYDKTKPASINIPPVSVVGLTLYK